MHHWQLGALSSFKNTNSRKTECAVTVGMRPRWHTALWLCALVCVCVCVLGLSVHCLRVNWHSLCRDEHRLMFQSLCYSSVLLCWGFLRLISCQPCKYSRIERHQIIPLRLLSLAQSAKDAQTTTWQWEDYADKLLSLKNRKPLLLITISLGRSEERKHDYKFICLLPAVWHQALTNCVHVTKSRLWRHLRPPHCATAINMPARLWLTVWQIWHESCGRPSVTWLQSAASAAYGCFSQTEFNMWLCSCVSAFLRRWIWRAAGCCGSGESGGSVFSRVLGHPRRPGSAFAQQHVHREQLCSLFNAFTLYLADIPRPLSSSCFSSTAWSCSALQ